MEPFIFIIIALILSIIIHEVSHGYMANALGDPTARLAGRLTLNPIPHIDPIGSVLIPGLLVFTGAGLLFGWAKPVPYNPYNLKNQRWGELLVAAAGPGINLVIAFIFAMLLRADLITGAGAMLAEYVVYINVLLAIFNMIPIPPLDGSKVLMGLLPLHAQIKYQEFGAQIERFGMFGMFLFIFLLIFVFGDAFFGFIQAFVSFLVGG